MFDFNIGEKAIFEEVNFTPAIVVKPGMSETHAISLGEAVFCTKEISWKYSVDGVDDGYGWPKQPMQITVADAFSQKTSSPQKFSPPKLLKEININIFNPSSIPVTTTLQISGTLVTPTLGEVLPQDQAIISYVSLDASQRGMLAINSQFMQEMRQLGATKAEPKAIAETAEPLALTSSFDEKTLISLLIGDIVSCGNDVDLTQIQELATKLVNKGWTRS